MAALAVDEQPNSPHRTAAGITAELLITHASQADSMPPEQITRVEQALGASHVRYTSVVYPDTRHGFTVRALVFERPTIATAPIYSVSCTARSPVPDKRGRMSCGGR